jgi:calcineurin-like phosphoesterase family protein
VATFAIGDIHGNLAALDGLLRRIEPDLRPGDTVVFLGDFIDRGPETRGCIDRVLALRASSRAQVVALLGNHEDWMLRSMRDHGRHSWILGMEALPTIASYSPAAARSLTAEMERLGVRLVTERVTLPYDLFFDAMPPAHRAFFEGLVPLHRTPEAVCTHGGCDPAAGPIENQSPDALIWGADDFPDRYTGPDLIVYGHRGESATDEAGWPRPQVGAHAIGIDTIAQGVLTAVRLPGPRFYRSDRHPA